MRWRIIHKGLTLIGVPILLTLVLILTLSVFLSLAFQQIKHELLLKEAMVTTDRLTRTLIVERTCAISFNACGDPTFIAMFDRKRPQVRELFERLQILLKDESSLAESLGSVKKDIAARQETDQKLLNFSTPDSEQILKERYRELLELVNNKTSKGRISTLSLLEKLQMLASRQAAEAHDTLHFSVLILLFGVCFSVAISLAFAVFQYRDINFRLLNIFANTMNLARGQPLKPAIKGSDEIAELDASLFNAGTDIREHEQFQHALLGVVSHEIKTPLTSVSGIIAALHDGLFGEFGKEASELSAKALAELERLRLLVVELLKPDNRDPEKFRRSIYQQHDQAMSANQLGAEKTTELNPAAERESERVVYELYSVDMARSDLDERGSKSLHFNLWRKLLVLMLVPIIFEIAFSCVLGVLIYETWKELQTEERSVDIIITANQVMNKLVDADIQVGSFMVTAERSYLLSWEQIKASAILDLARLKELTRNDAVQYSNVELSGQYLLSSFAACKRALDAPEESLAKMWKAANSSPGTRKFVGEAQEPTDRVLSRENLNGKRYARNREKMCSDIKRALAASTVIDIALSLLLASFFIRSITSRLQQLVLNTRLLASGQELPNPIRGNDEITLLDRFFVKTSQYLRSLQTSKREMISTISDELKIPLDSVHNIIEQFLAGELGPLSEKASKRLSTARKEVARLIRLITELTDIQTMESGKFDLDIAEIALSDVLQSTLAAVDHLSAQTGVRIEAAPEGAFRLRADKDRLTQVVINLVSNAIKFSPRGSTVKIKVCPRGNMLDVHVIDQGRGIPTELKDKIFERFFQVEEEDASKRGGSGLGLSIVRTIVEQHGGSITVLSEEGKGSTFIVSLPAAQLDEASSGKN